MSDIVDERYLVIIPTYNEVENIELITNEIFEKYNDLQLDILVIDDNSTDGTSQLLKKLMIDNSRLKLIEREGKLGLGTAYIEGFKYAVENRYDYIVQMDADFSHDPDYLKDMFKEIKDNDLVIGSRYINGINVVNWPMSRLLLSYFASLYTRVICGLPVKDPTGGFKCFRREVLETINLDNIGASGYSFQIEVNFRVWKKKFKIKEIPIIFKDRTRGESKMSTGIITEAIYLIWKLRVLSILKKI